MSCSERPISDLSVGGIALRWYRLTVSLHHSISLITVGVLSTAGALGQTFTLIGRPDGSLESVGTGLSSDGSTAVGYSTGIGGAYVWTASGGRYDFGFEQGIPIASQARGVSGDGSVVVGFAGTNGTPIAYRWSGPGTFESLGVIGRFRKSYATDANRDGSVVVGRLEDGLGTVAEPFVWTRAGGMRSLGRVAGSFIAEATAVSDDGNTVVGWGVGGAERGFIWTAGAGMRMLQGLPGTDGSTEAFGLSRDGAIVVGFAGGEATGAMWRDGVVVNLGKLADTREFLAVGVDDLGSVVIGTSDGTTHIATIWTPDRHIERLSDYFASLGMSMPAGASLVSCDAVSADGRTFTGTAVIDGVGIGFVATVPAPGSALLLGLGVLGATRHRRTS